MGTSIQRSYEFGLFGGLRELYRHGLTPLSVGSGSTLNGGVGRFCQGRPTKILMLSFGYGGFFISYSLASFKPLRKSLAREASSPVAPRVELTNPVTFGPKTTGISSARILALPSSVVYRPLLSSLGNK